MKRRIAVFASGWGDEYFRRVVFGISEAAKKENIDTFAFVNFSIRGLDALLNEGEFNIFTLPDLEDFDGVILLANSFNLTREVEYFTEKLRELKLPAISVEYEMENATALMSDNYAGMYDLVKHVIEEHGARELVYIGGPQAQAENVDRLMALHNAAKEKGFEIPDANIKYGNWERESGGEIVKEWMAEHGALPDAFLCANDMMAMGACEQLEVMGYNVPKDVIVTGFDCLREGQEFYPSIASVGHDWVEMGNVAFSMLMRKMKGDEPEPVTLAAKFVSATSCGCYRDDNSDNKNVTGRNTRKNEIDGLQADTHFRHIYLWIRKIDNAEDLSESLSDLFSKEHRMEGDDFMLCLDPEFFQIEEDDLNLYVTGYNDKMEIIGSILDGKPLPRTVKQRNEALHWLARQNKEPRLYTVVPILGDLRTYGFAVLTGDLRIALPNQFYIWTRHTSQYLEQVRRNLTISDLTRKLTQLSVTDVLTGVYNRAGCEQIAFPMLEEWRNRGGSGVIMLVDIDKMKMINDEYGHSDGDLALRTVASVLKSGLPEDWIVSRYGGDEFFVGGRLQGEESDLEKLRGSLESRLMKEVKKRDLKFPLSISIGTARMLPEDTIDITEYLQMADDDMYEIKQAHHKKMENKQ
ncbi:MAG: GGDEF domain-containing protein [Lachnospiraceae bacterium]|nr:GGDEF domain-containing protein [Lachnospiraceae bacterium]